MYTKFKLIFMDLRLAMRRFSRAIARHFRKVTPPKQLTPDQALEKTAREIQDLQNAGKPIPPALASIMGLQERIVAKDAAIKHGIARHGARKADRTDLQDLKTLELSLGNIMGASQA